MSDVTATNAEELVENSKSRFFQIFLVNPKQLLCWTKRPGFENVEIDGFSNMQVYKRTEIVEEYYNALRAARAEKSDLFSGRLEISQLPTF